MFSPVASALVPAQSNDEIAWVVPAGIDTSGTLIVLEVGEVAVVVLDVIDGLTLCQRLALRLFNLGDRTGNGAAKQAAENGGKLHGGGRMSKERMRG